MQRTGRSPLDPALASRLGKGDVDAGTACRDLETAIEALLSSPQKKQTKIQKAAAAAQDTYRKAYPLARLIINIFKSGTQVYPAMHEF